MELMLVVERRAVRSSAGTVGRTRWLMRRISVAAGLLLAIVYVGTDVGTAMGFGGYVLGECLENS